VITSRAEKKFEVSRRMPEVCPELGFPVSAEALANECYWLELDNAPAQRAWAYRKAAWAIEDTEQDVGLIYQTMGRKGLESIENLGPRMAKVVEGLVKE